MTSMDSNNISYENDVHIQIPPRQPIVSRLSPPDAEELSRSASNHLRMLKNYHVVRPITSGC